MGVPERGTINIGTPSAHPHLDYVNVERRVSRLRIHLAPGRKLLPLLHRADVICAVYLKDRNKYSRRYKYMKLISRAQFLLCTSLGKLGKQYKRSYNRGGGGGSTWTFVTNYNLHSLYLQFYCANIEMISRQYLK